MANLSDSLTKPRTVLVCVPTAADAAVIERLLASEQAQAERCRTFEALADKELADAAAVMISEEMLDENSLDLLVKKLKQQPTWSDLPVVLVSAKGSESIIAQRAMEAITGLLLLDRPVHLATLGSALRMALRTRRRQYRLRDLLLERKQRERELHQINQELNEYTYALTHNVKAPFRAIQNYANFLLEDMADTLGGEPRQFLDGIKRAIGLANQQFEDLEALYKVKDHTLEFEFLDMRELLGEIAALHDGMPDCDLVVTPQWPILRGERFLLRQILMALVSNGFKYNRSDRKRVAVTWQRSSDSRFEILVSDNGIGIDPQYHEHIFHIFKRLHTEEEYEGTGIGLSIVRRAVQRIGGELRIEPPPVGEGSTFVISLPATVVEDGCQE